MDVEVVYFVVWLFVSILLVESKKVIMFPLAVGYVSLSLLMYTDSLVFDDFVFLVISICIFVYYLVNAILDRL